jgi:2-polyprenyl-3-methyl-5-hydroxy-6-metoxy-1,4-benzoquinol methylase
MAERAHPELKGFKNTYFGLKRNPYRVKLFERYHFCNQYINKKSVCDIPCGTGWGTSLLRKYKDVIGIDISEEAINYANSHYGNYNRKFLQGDMSSIPVASDSVDVVLCLEGFEHVSKEIAVKFVVECKRILKRNGYLILTCPVLNEKGERTNNPYHIHEYDEEELIDIFNRNFRIIKIERIIGPDSPIYRIVVQNFKNNRYL